MFVDDVQRFSVKIEDQTTAVLARIVDLAHESIQLGSPITAAPGQPVDTGALRDSWQKFYESPTAAVISTDLVYAPSIEDGLSYAHGGKPMQLRSEVGGFHSVKLTVAGFQRIADAAVADVARG